VFISGYDIFSGSKDYGPFAKLGQLSKKNGKIFKIYSYGYPLVSVSGVDNIKSLLKNEFKDDGIGTFMIGKQNIGKIFGENMLLYENNNEKHSMLRRLVGTAMTPGAIAAGIPSIQERANYHINEMLKTNQVVKFEDAFQSFTLDIAWKQILGLDLKEEDIPKFHDAVRDWTDGMLNPFFLVPFKVPGLEKYTKAGRAATYLRGKIEEKISKLEKDGPDSSTLSKLYYATDEDGTRLTREQVIDNSLLLIFAGTETSASTLTCAALFLTLHPDVWNKVRAEQNEIKAKYGDDLTSEALENSVYLDAVIKETLRLQPVELGELRKVKESVVVDGKQIPKKWYAFFNVKQTHYNDPSTYQEDGSHMDHFKGFKPDRWLSESTKPKEWMPFGDGRRRCIGERLGMTEMKVFLSMLARKVAKCELVNTIDADHEIVWQKGNAMARPANAECTLVAA
jgi:cytochrome P450